MKNFDYDKVMSTYKTNLKKTALLKSFMIGLIGGCSAAFGYAIVDWIIGLKLFYIGLAIMVGVTALVSIILYLTAFRPTDIKIARTLDQQGLYERVVTMYEFKNDNSFMACKQREDTVNVLKNVGVKVVLPLALILTVAFGAVTSAGALTYSALAETSGLQLFTITTESYSVVCYEVDKKTSLGGYISGETTQKLVNGSNTTMVTAIAYDGWEFVSWSDGLENPTRSERNVQNDATYTATFQKIDGSVYEVGDPDEDPGYDGDPGMLGNKKGTPGGPKGILPPVPSTDGDEYGGDGGDNGDGNPDRSDYTSKVIDGETYYGDEMENAIAGVSEDDNSTELNNLINEYFGGLGGN